MANIFSDINMAGVAVDDDGYPTIFGDLIEGMQAVQEDEVATAGATASGSAAGAAAAAAAGAVAAAVVAAAGAAEDNLPSIRPINPNVRARKLQVNAVAKKQNLKRMQQKALHQQSTRS